MAANQYTGPTRNPNPVTRHHNRDIGRAVHVSWQPVGQSYPFDRDDLFHASTRPDFLSAPWVHLGTFDAAFDRAATIIGPDNDTPVAYRVQVTGRVADETLSDQDANRINQFGTWDDLLAWRCYPPDVTVIAYLNEWEHYGSTSFLVRSDAVTVVERIDLDPRSVQDRIYELQEEEEDRSDDIW